MTNNLIWDKITDCANTVQKLIEENSTEYDQHTVSGYPWPNHLYHSEQFRRAHIEIVDQREHHKLLILHCTIFPHLDDPSPIWGFDAVCGPNKISGAFLDYSAGGDPNHAMMKWFAKQSAESTWSKNRELPEWARNIFSPDMVAAGNLKTEAEIAAFCTLAIRSLKYYLKHVGKTRTPNVTYNLEHSRYCYNQRQNPRVLDSMVAMGYDPALVNQFITQVLFPESHK